MKYRVILMPRAAGDLDKGCLWASCHAPLESLTIFGLGSIILA